MEILENAKETAIEAIYHNKPHGVGFAGNNSVEAIILEGLLSKLRIPYRRLEKSDYLKKIKGQTKYINQWKQFF